MRDLGLLLMRAIIGSLFAIHGYPKLFGGPGKPIHPLAQRHLGQGFVQFMEKGGMANFRSNVTNMGMPVPAPLAWAAALSEFAGGIMLILGWKTRFAALALTGTMAVAVQKVTWKNGLVGQGGWELSASLVAGLLALLLGGPGAISIDGDE